MQRYVEQLIEDIRKGKDFVPEDVKLSDDYEEFAERMMELENSDEIELSKLFQLEKVMFPAIEKLSNEQIDLITNELLELWEAFYIEAIYPEKLPNSLLYPLLVLKLDAKIQYWPGWITSIEFCNYDLEQCPFGEVYCTCKDIDSSWETEFEDYLKISEDMNETDELPY